MIDALTAHNITRPLGYTPAEEIEAKLAEYAMKHYSHRALDCFCEALGEAKKWMDFGEETALSVMKAAMRQGLNS